MAWGSRIDVEKASEGIVHRATPLEASTWVTTCHFIEIRAQSFVSPKEHTTLCDPDFGGHERRDICCVKSKPGIKMVDPKAATKSVLSKLPLVCLSPKPKTDIASKQACPSVHPVRPAPGT